MKIAITGGSGFVGRHLARKLVQEGHQVHLISRGFDHRDESIYNLENSKFFSSSVTDYNGLLDAFEGCDAVAHCAGINREIGKQTYENVHVQGTQNVINAAKEQNIKQVLFLSFLRARPNCGSKYHESKWRAEEIIRDSGLNFTIFKAGVIYGDGDHMLDHLSRAFHTFPLFGFVGFSKNFVRPTAVNDIVDIMKEVLLAGRLSKQTVSVTGPEQLTLEQAVKRVASVVGKKPLFFRLPIWVHYCLAFLCEAVMKEPLIAIAQVRMLSEGVVVPGPLAAPLPEDLLPQVPFTEEMIKQGLPQSKSFGLSDLICPLSNFCKA